MITCYTFPSDLDITDTELWLEHSEEIKSSIMTIRAALNPFTDVVIVLDGTAYAHITHNAAFNLDTGEFLSMDLAWLKVMLAKDRAASQARPAAVSVPTAKDSITPIIMAICPYEIPHTELSAITIKELDKQHLLHKVSDKEGNVSPKLLRSLYATHIAAAPTVKGIVFKWVDGAASVLEVLQYNSTESELAGLLHPATELWQVMVMRAPMIVGELVTRDKAAALGERAVVSRYFKTLPSAAELDKLRKYSNRSTDYIVVIYRAQNRSWYEVQSTVLVTEFDLGI